jgi:hypothetical protein
MLLTEYVMDVGDRFSSLLDPERVACSMHL